jgi:hypothetical protein
MPPGERLGVDPVPVSFQGTFPNARPAGLHLTWMVDRLGDYRVVFIPDWLSSVG